MRAAIVAMQAITDAGDDFFAARDNEARTEETGYALAIASALNGAGYTPWLICNAESPLAFAPVPVPRLCLKDKGLAAFFKLWQWQRRQENMLVIAVGEGSLKHAVRLFRMGKKLNRRLAAAFLTLPPGKDCAKLLGNASKCICGSQFIINRVGEILDQAKNKPDLIHVAPGIDLSSYPDAPAPWQEGGRFVFGMAGSLMPQSGALLAVRAMSALWQNEDVPPWEVRMFGSGPRYAEIVDEAASLGVLSRLSVLDDQPLGEVSSHCHVWLAPGIAPDELPPTLWAGFAAGLPVICAKSWLHKERVRDKSAVLSIGPENPQEMARAMLGLMRDPALRKRMAKASWNQRSEISIAAMAGRVRDALPGAPSDGYNMQQKEPQENQEQNLEAGKD